MSDLDHKLRTLPDQPGVYLWKGADGRVLYVGKAKRLRQRLRSYLGTGADDSLKVRHLMRHAVDVETIVVATEPQALLLENNLIKEHRPRYNVLLRDDKSYPSIAVTLGEPFPRVLVVRRLNLPGARYFGPYTDVSKLRETLRIIRRIFTVRSCHYDLPHDAPARPCLDYHIDRCRAPCVGYQSQSDYRRMIDDVVLFLEGKTVDVRRRLRERMHDASSRMDYERAAELRDALAWLDQLERPQVVERVGGGSVDVIGYARDDDDACGVILRVRDGRVIAREYRFLENVRQESDETVLAAFLVRHYLGLEGRAGRVLLPFPPEELEAIVSLVPETSWHVPQRGVGERLTALAAQNAVHLLESLRLEALETEERADDPVYALGRDLGLTVVPRAMVTVDISTNQGRDTVGSLVWFEAGRPKKSEYRRYRIRGSDGEPDDYAAVAEVVTRFLSRRLANGAPLPDLVVIDGGKGQLAAAVEAARAGGVELPIVSLAKREEEVYVTGRREPLRLSRRSPSLKLLQRARDEAHRFAVTYSRQRQRARTITSELLRVPGIGPARRSALLQRFGSLAGVQSATAAEIAAVPGFSSTLADRVLEHLKERT